MRVLDFWTDILQELVVLDLGCGQGYFTNYLSKNAEAHGLDKDGKNLAIAKQKFKRPIFAEGKAEHLPYDNEFFDEVYCYDILEHVKDSDKVLEEVYRVMKPQGRLHVIIPHYNSEKLLTKIRPSYPKEIGHKRVYIKGEMDAELISNCFTITKKQRYQFMKNIELILILRKEPLISEFGETKKKKSFFWRGSFFVLSKIIDPVMQHVYPKSIKYEAVKTQSIMTRHGDD